MKRYYLFFIVALLLLFIPEKAFAALYINEFSSATSNSDWVEIYNSDSSPVDLTGFILRDSTESNKLDLSGTIGGNSYSVFDWNNKLNNDGDTVRLLKTDETQVDQVVYGGSGNIPVPTGTQTAGRQADGSPTWVLFANDTKGSSNNSATIVPTPTVTPTPTNTPAPTQTPTPTPKPTNTPTPTPTGTPTPTPKTTNTPTPKITSDPKTREGGSESALMQTQTETEPTQGILGANAKFANSQSELPTTTAQNYNWGALLIVMGIVLVTGACGILLYNNYRKNKEQEIEASP